jgi:uncharacterized protein (AIM24 family)
MDVEISAGPAFALTMTRRDVQITTSTQAGFLKRLPRTLGGEGFFVTDFTGLGRVWMQTRSSIDLIQRLSTKLSKDHS